MPKKPKPIPTDKIPDIAAAMKAKAKNPVTVTPEGLVKSLTKPIQEMLDVGYSYENVSALLLEHGVELTARNIQRYHRQHPPAQSKPSPPPSTPEASEPAAPAAPDHSEETTEKIPGKTPEKTPKTARKTTQKTKKMETEPLASPPPKQNPPSAFNITDRTTL